MFRKSLLFVFVILALMVAMSQPALAAGNSPAAPVLASIRRMPSRPLYRRFQTGSAGSEVNQAAQRARGLGGEIYYTYDAALVGFAASLPEPALKGLAHNPMWTISKPIRLSLWTRPNRRLPGH